MGEQTHKRTDSEILYDANVTPAIQTTTGGGQDIDDDHDGYEWIETALKQCDEIGWMQYLDNFKKQAVTDCRLKHVINDEILNQLIPEIDIRKKFKALFDNKQKVTDQ